MAKMLLVLLAMFSPLGFCQENLKSEIPPLTPESIQELLLFEFEELGKEDLTIKNIRQLDDRARADLVYHGQELPLQLICKKTDFGISWRLTSVNDLRKLLFKDNSSEDVSENKASEAAEPKIGISDVVPAEETKSKPASRKKAPAEKADPYQTFLRTFFQTLKQGDESKFADFYFRDEDFKLENAQGEDGDPRETLSAERARFVKECLGLSQQLQKYETLTVQSFVASSSTKVERLRLRELMPGARRFKASVSMELLLDGQLGNLTVEGLVLLPSGWRLGKIAAIDLP